MSQSGRKVVAELTKVWESVIAKGKEGGSGVQDFKKWLSESPAVTSFQTAINQQVDRLQRLPGEINKSRALSSPSDLVTEETRMKVGRLMAAYEELIGIREVRSAHERVLSTEAKFIECQEQRREASKHLHDIQNKLVEIRAELDRTHRGDEPYLDFIKKEIAATKEERIMRKNFDDWERTEREMFSELSNALRFSHEKERAQNEKTKYWSIVGSMIGAGLGILGTTINNRMKQNHVKRVLEETSSQVAAIQATVNNLTTKFGESSPSSSPPPDISGLITTLKEQQEELATQGKAVEEAVQLIKNAASAHQVQFHNQSWEHRNRSVLSSPTLLDPDLDLKALMIENKWHVTAVLCCIASVLIYKFG